MSINRNMSILAAGASSTGGLSNVASIGIGMTPVNVLDITQTQNSASIISLLNASSGVAANSRLYLGNATSATRGRLIQWGSSFTATGVYRQDGLLLECTGAGGVTIAANAVQPIYFAINDAEKMRLDDSGNLGIGCTPSFLLHIQAGAPVITLSPANYAAGPNYYRSQFGTNANAACYLIFGNNADNEIRAGASAAGGFLDIFVNNTTYIGTASDGIRAVRFLATGTVCFAKTAQDSTTGGVSIFKSTSNNNGRIDLVKSTTGNSDAIANYYSSSYVGGITYSDTATALVTSSDERIKQNITDVSSQLLVLADIKVREFEFIADPDKRVKGFIAQELYKVAPEAVYVGTETEDGNIDRPWAVNPTALIPILVKAIQELTTRLAALEAK